MQRVFILASYVLVVALNKDQQPGLGAEGAVLTSEPFTAAEGGAFFFSPFG